MTEKVEPAPRYEFRPQGYRFQVYDLEGCSIAYCETLRDAELIVSALNSVPGLRNLVNEMRGDRERFMRLYGPPERYEGS